ncbi:S66 peptidase family protein [Salinicoccus hispanicus]|uniref:LD-carboxypeptidase n=1 Tax=Salinicoccus hispanicus TaxID=157225 RepID=A0A6N8TWN7_9STAP|nr:S66 peptidase family protein [Salinicoccus hispanicus]MXQ50113.1 LD-carboxypeptidase [Salinicoccus hispanicus]
MIQYPTLNKNATVGVTAPSSGVPDELHVVLHTAINRMKDRGYSCLSGDTPWMDDKAKSAPAVIRAKELNEMLSDEMIDLIIPPWGGELLIEILEHINFETMPNKWIMGFSDISLLLLAVTLNTGTATAHGSSLVDLRAIESDDTTAMWETVLATKQNETVTQYASEKYQKEWDHENPTHHVFNLDTQTYWRTMTGQNTKVEGRLLGGCIDAIRHLIGTPFGDVHSFKNKHISGEPIIWYLENYGMSTAELRRSLVQMKLAGWFEDASAIMFGRSPANTPVDNYTAKDVYEVLSEELDIPIIYDIDCGHVPPQITFINGAYAEVEVENGRGKVIQTFK